MKEFAQFYLIQRLQRENTELYQLLDNLWKEIQPSIPLVKTLFPEYTPHDATHLFRLFELTERILKIPLLENLNTTEVFLLSASIIGHDWGMAIGQPETSAILDTEATQSHIIFTLKNEWLRIKKYQATNGMINWSSASLSFASPSDEDKWRNYIRDTHPERSASRIRSYFNDHGEEFLGDAVALICWGHGRERSDIEFNGEYVAKLQLRGEIVNLRALTLYLRLIDLLDVGSFVTRLSVASSSV